MNRPVVKQIVRLVLVLVTLLGCGRDSKPLVSCLIKRPTDDPVICLGDERTHELTIDVGDLDDTRLTQISVALANPTDHEFTIAKLESTCECVLLQKEIGSIKAKSVSTVTLTVDLSSKPNFFGKLAARLSAYSSSGLHLFELTVHVNVPVSVVMANEVVPLPIPMPEPQVDDNGLESDF